MKKNTSFMFQRMILARECANELGLKELPSELYEFAVELSELPEDLYDEESKPIKQSTLLSMGLAYPYHENITFINTNGQTMILPNNEIFKEELRKCGYLVCKECSYLPDTDMEIERESQVNAEEYNYSKKYEYETLLEELRKKYTLSKELTEKVFDFEWQFFYEISEISKNDVDGYPYDIFDSKFYRGGEVCEKYSWMAPAGLDLDSKNARKFLAMFNSEPNVTNPGINVKNMRDLLLLLSNDSILSDDLYYAPGGAYENFKNISHATKK